MEDFLAQHKIQGIGKKKKTCAVMENSKTLDRKTGSWKGIKLVTETAVW